MPSLNTKRFTDPDTLHLIRRESLIAWLTPAADFLAGRGVTIPDPASEANVDCETLAAVFLESDESMPACLVESLYIIHEMANEDGMDAILEAAPAHGLTLDLGDEPAPADVAVQAWLQDRAVLEEIHNQHQLKRPRSFVYFSCRGDTVPAFQVPSPEAVQALEARLEAWFLRRKRGPGSRVLMYPKENECWFLIRHGLPCKREGAMKDGLRNVSGRKRGRSGT